MNHKSLIVTRIVVLLLSGLLATAIASAQTQIKASADSTTLVMGDRVTVNLEVLKDSHTGELLNLPKKNQDYNGLEFLDITADSTELSNGRVQLNYNIYFQAFDPSDLLTLPPFAYAVGTDTAYSDILTFKVLPVVLSPELGDPEDIENLTIHPDEGPVSIPSKWYDWIPDWWVWVVIALIAIALGVVIYFLYKKNGPSLFVPRRLPTPFEIATQRLQELKRRRLIEQGQTKMYYTELIDILRAYLEGRFGINAMEMPTKQILKKLRENKETHLSSAQMEQVLHLADFVKFAAANPDPLEGQKTFNTISDFVMSTKPEPTPEEQNKVQKKRKG